MIRRCTLIAVAVALCGAALSGVPGSASASLSPLHWDGHALRDSLDREVTLRGLNVVFKKDPYLPSSEGSTITASSMNDADATLIARWGFNVVRLGLIWKAVEPSPGFYDEDYIGRARMIVETLAAHGIYTLLDFHQDVFNERYGGEGAPDWAVASPLPATNTGNWGANYFTPAVMNEFDIFWTPTGLGASGAYADAWARVALRFRDVNGVLGYDLFNEPWPGTQWPTCASPLGCPVFDTLFLQPFYEKVIASIRTVDATHMLYVAPNVTANFGAGVNIGPFNDPGAGPVGIPQIGLGYHVYCLQGSIDGSFSGSGASCPYLEDTAATTQVSHAASIGAHALMTEFGASDDTTDLERVQNMTESAGGASRIYWSYKQFDDPTGSPTESILDASLQPKAKLPVLAQPFARVVAGSALSSSWDAVNLTLHVSYEATGGDTEIVWPVAVHGAYAASAACDCTMSSSGDLITIHADGPGHVTAAISAV